MHTGQKVGKNPTFIWDMQQKSIPWLLHKTKFQNTEFIKIVDTKKDLLKKYFWS